MMFNSLFAILLLLIQFTHQQDNLESGIITSVKKLGNENLTSIFYYVNETDTHEGVYLVAVNSSTAPSTNEIKIYLSKIPERAYLNFIDNHKVNGSIQRVKLIRSLSKYLSINETHLKISAVSYKKKQQREFLNASADDAAGENDNESLQISLVNTDKSLNCKDFVRNTESLLRNSVNSSIKFENNRLLNGRISRIELVDNCGKKSSVGEFLFIANSTDTLMDTYGASSFYTGDDFLIAVVIPATIMAAMLFLSIVLACVLNHLNKKKKRDAELKAKNPIYKQKSYMSKGVPVIMYEEMAEKSNEEEETLTGGHSRMPLIMRNEKPPQPAPPEYRKQLSLQHLNDEQTINDIKNMLNNAPLASTEQLNDDMIPFLELTAGGKIDDSLYYMPPQPIVVGLRDVSRRQPQTTASQNQTQMLP